MWVRIDEISFAPEQSEDVVDHVRNSAVTRHEGEGFRGFRLLVDQPHGRALDVSYWELRGWRGVRGCQARSRSGDRNGSDAILHLRDAYRLRLTGWGKTRAHCDANLRHASGQAH